MSPIRNTVMVFVLLVVTVFSTPALHQSNGRQPQVSRHPYVASEPLPQPALFAEGIISTGDDESHPAFTPDGRTIFFLKNTPSFDFWTIVMSQFNGRKWSVPQVAPFSGQYSDADPFITTDGSKFFFISTRPVGAETKKNDTDIWMMDRTPEGWGEPHHLGLRINSDKSEWFPTIASSGTIYFGSSRSGGKGATDLYRCRLINGEYSEPENLGATVNTAADEVEPFIAPDESYLIFAASGRPGGMGAFDLYVSFQRNGKWTEPRSLGAPINSDAWDFSPKVSPDGRYFFFTSSRGHGRAPREKRLSYDELSRLIHNPRNGLRDIYQIDLSALHLER